MDAKVSGDDLIVADPRHGHHQLIFNLLGGAHIALLLGIGSRFAQENRAIGIGRVGQATRAHQKIGKMLAAHDGIGAREAHFALNRDGTDADVGEYLIEVERIARRTV